jgi:hypothetical protein
MSAQKWLSFKDKNMFLSLNQVFIYVPGIQRNYPQNYTKIFRIKLILIIGFYSLSKDYNLKKLGAVFPFFDFFCLVIIVYTLQQIFEELKFSILSPKPSSLGTSIIEFLYN